MRAHLPQENLDYRAIGNCPTTKATFECYENFAEINGVISARPLSDALKILFHPFMDAPISCVKSADSNDDGELDTSDTVYLLGYLFGGNILNQPLGSCGIDPTPDELTCESYNVCP